MNACEIKVRSSVDDLPDEAILSDALAGLRREASDFHEEVASAVQELKEKLSEAYSAGSMLKNGSLFSNPVMKGIGSSMMFTVDMVRPTVDEVSDMVTTAFEAFDVAAGGAGNPNRIGAIADHLRDEVSEKLVAFADAMSYSNLATPGKWESPAAAQYHFHADVQTTVALRPLAASIKDIASSLEEYAGSQVDYANEVSKLWLKLFWFMLSVLGMVLSGIKSLVGYLGSKGAGVPFKALEVLGWVTGFITSISAARALFSIEQSLDRVLEMPHAPCELLEQRLLEAGNSVDIAWPGFIVDR